jgi:hypothetical protein
MFDPKNITKTFGPALVQGASEQQVAAVQVIGDAYAKIAKTIEGGYVPEGTRDFALKKLFEAKLATDYILRNFWSPKPPRTQ